MTETMSRDGHKVTEFQLKLRRLVTTQKYSRNSWGGIGEKIKGHGKVSGLKWERSREFRNRENI